VHNKEKFHQHFEAGFRWLKNPVDAGKVSINLLQKIIEILFHVLFLIEIFEKL